MPVRILIVVDFPAPFGPMKPSSSPASIWNVSLRTASTELYSGLKSERMEPRIPAALRLVWNVFWRLVTSMAGMLFTAKGAKEREGFVFVHKGYCSLTGEKNKRSVRIRLICGKPVLLLEGVLVYPIEKIYSFFKKG